MAKQSEKNIAKCSLLYELWKTPNGVFRWFYKNTYVETLYFGDTIENAISSISTLSNIYEINIKSKLKTDPILGEHHADAEIFIK